MKQLKNLGAIVLSKEQQKKIRASSSLGPEFGNGACFCSDGRVIDMGQGAHPPADFCALLCECDC